MDVGGGGLYCRMWVVVICILGGLCPCLLT